MDSKQNTIKELTTQEATDLLNLCKRIESMRQKGIAKGTNDSDNWRDARVNVAIKQAVKTVKATPFIKYESFKIELNYDRSSKNWFICYEAEDSPYMGYNFEYTGTREDSSVGFIWKVIEYLTPLLEK